ncbi:MAG: MoxR family ATPase [Firmicutes bacterium]|nr:MoxR family ATPase [[Eubacterium] siraeum]MCM1487538.1 MoxR family ATPase [Bacillota bacterium]
MNCKEYAQKISENIGKVIKGKDVKITAAIAAVLAGGNILLEDVPGTGKTVLAKALAKSIGCDFKRIQLTPDLLPSDITGIHYFNMKEQVFELRKGPVFTNILLADEINRATPRTQSALLECMEEKQVTIDGDMLKLEPPFIVIATQNPVENAGTFPLPEAQLDRFLVKISLGYAERNDEDKILKGIGFTHPIDGLQAVADGSRLPEMQRQASEITVNDTVNGYILDIGIATRNSPDIKLGVSTRGMIAVRRLSQAFAAIEGKDFVTPDHVQRAARYAVPHRLICRGITGEKAIDDIIGKTPVPTEQV